MDKEDPGLEAEAIIQSADGRTSASILTHYGQQMAQTIGRTPTLELFGRNAPKRSHLIQFYPDKNENILKVIPE